MRSVFRLQRWCHLSAPQAARRERLPAPGETLTIQSADARSASRSRDRGIVDMIAAGTGPLRSPWVLVGAGIVVALNVGKLPPALSALQHEFGLSLVQVSWMISLFLLGSALFGIVGGSLADRFDPRRMMIGGLALTALAGAVGAAAPNAAVLFASRALESVAFLLTVLPAPALLRQIVPASSLRGWLGAWAAYMPTGMGAGLFFAPSLMAIAGWRSVWIFCAAAAALWAV
ncbi:MAG: MFS transporter, partial [Burkholderiales bacterium]